MWIYKITNDIKNKAFIQKRCDKQITKPYHNRYMFEDYKE